MGGLFGGGGDSAGALREENRKRDAELKLQKQDQRQKDARKNASARRARIGGAGARSLLTNGFKGVDNKTSAQNPTKSSLG